MHGLGLLAFGIVQILRNVMGHAGAEVHSAAFGPGRWLGWNNTTTHHDLHHETGRYNYGLYFRWWDKLMGTEHPDYQRKFEAIIAPQTKTTPPAIAGRVLARAIAGSRSGRRTSPRRRPGPGRRRYGGGPAGRWATPGVAAIVELAPCSDTSGLCGTIRWLWDAVDEKGRPRLDAQNADAGLRAQTAGRAVDPFRADAGRRKAAGRVGSTTPKTARPTARPSARPPPIRSRSKAACCSSARSRCGGARQRSPPRCGESDQADRHPEALRCARHDRDHAGLVGELAVEAFGTGMALPRFDADDSPRRASSRCRDGACAGTTRGAHRHRRGCGWRACRRRGRRPRTGRRAAPGDDRAPASDMRAELSRPSMGRRIGAGSSCSKTISCAARGLP